MGFIGLSPSNFLSPIDFVPFLGPVNRLRKAAKYANTARKSRWASGLIGKGRYYTNAGLAAVQGTLGTAGMYLDMAATKMALGYGSDLYDSLEDLHDHTPMGRGRGKLAMYVK